MDLLFSRYASPFLLIDNLIVTNSLDDFILNLFQIMNDERKERTRWEFFLHKVYNKSWAEFMDDVKLSEEQKEVDLGATIQKSKNMLRNFTPEREV